MLTQYQQQKIKELKKICIALYKQGLTTREISEKIDKKRSHAWVAIVIQKYNKEKGGSK
jgi:transposase-like protein